MDIPGKNRPVIKVYRRGSWSGSIVKKIGNEWETEKGKWLQNLPMQKTVDIHNRCMHGSCSRWRQVM
jgi:hypothetical protein